MAGRKGVAQPRGADRVRWPALLEYAAGREGRSLMRGPAYLPETLTSPRADSHAVCGQLSAVTAR
jgi:hypothetical protein